MTLQEAQQSVDEWIKTYGVRYFNELTNMACLTEEVGELARVIARKYGEQSFKPGDKANLGEEIAQAVSDQIFIDTGLPLAPHKPHHKKGDTNIKEKMSHD